MNPLASKGKCDNVLLAQGNITQHRARDVRLEQWWKDDFQGETEESWSKRPTTNLR